MSFDVNLVEPLRKAMERRERLEAVAKSARALVRAMNESCEVHADLNFYTRMGDLEEDLNALDGEGGTK